MTAASLPNDPTAVLARAAVWAGVVACVAGLFLHSTWSELPTARAGEAALLALLSAVLTGPLVRLRKWRRAEALATFWLALLVLTCGPLALAAALLLGLAAVALGAWIAPSRGLVATGIVGASVLAALVGWLAPLRVHFAWTYLPLLVALVAWRASDVRALLGTAFHVWRATVDASPRASAWGVTAIGLASTAAWLPTMQYDDLAYHLALPWHLLVHGRHPLDVSQQVWALAPWSGDALHAIAQVVAGVEARGPVNALWLLAVAASAWHLAALLGAGMAYRWACAALVATLPMMATLVAGMQTELPATAVLLALACLVSGKDAGTRPLVTLALMLGLLAGLKLLHPATALVLVAAGIWRWRATLVRHPSSGLLAPAAALLTGGSSYFHAWAATGNPVLPLLNDVFRSPAFAPSAFRDARWTTDSPLALPWSITFDTARFFEGWDGALGFALVALAGASLVALFRRDSRVVAIAGLAAIAIPLTVLPYARYVLPGVALLIPAAVRAVEVTTTRRAGLGLLAGLCALHIGFAANSDWTLRTGAVKRSLGALGADAPLFRRYAPERIVAARIRADHPGARVLDLTGAAHAEFAGAAGTATWYAPRLHAAATAADRDRSGNAWAALLAREGVTDVMFRPTRLAPARAAALERLRADHVLTVDEVEWRRIPPRSPR